MIKFLKKLGKLNKKNNKGMSIVTVIVAIGFVIILVNILLLTSAINFKMRNVNVKAKDSFYSAEAVLDEISIGLQLLVSDSLSNAYTNVLTTYNDPDLSSDAKNELVKAEFYESIEDAIAVDTTHYICMPVADGAPNEGLYGFLKSSTRWNLGPDASSAEDDYGAFIRSKANTDDGTYYTGEMKMTNTDGIVLKDLIVYYKDPNGFVSAVKTDIHILYPDFAFDTLLVPSISSYSFITDTALVKDKPVANRNAADNTVISGDSFAYRMDITGTKLDFKMSGSGMDTHVVAEGITLKNAGITTYDRTTLWADDIVAQGSTVTLAGYTYIQDDLNLKGQNTDLTMTGYYTGYGNSTTASQKSSAILVNGTDTVIDLSAAKRVSLAGRAFVSTTNSNAKNKIKAEADATTFDVYLGESIAAKADQLCYLVPAECIGVDANNNSLFNKNPLTNAEYNTIVAAGSGYTEIALNKPVAKLGNAGNTLGEFIKTDLSGKAEAQKVFVRTKDGSDRLVYYYMKFKDEEAANLYFSKYYGWNKESVDNYMDIYLKSIKMPDSSSAALKISVAGNVMEDTVEDGETVRNIGGYLKTNDGTGMTLEETLQDDFESYSEQFEGYCTKLTPELSSLQGVVFRGEQKTTTDISALSDTERDDADYADNHALFRNLVNEEVLADMKGTYEGTYKSDSIKAIITDSNVNSSVISDDVHLIVTTKDVDLTGLSSFEGLIIAKGKITLPSGNNFEMKANKNLVDACMMLKDIDEVYAVADVFTDMDNVRFDSKKKENKSSKVTESGDVVVSDLIVFENWTKEVEIN